MIGDGGFVSNKRLRIDVEGRFSPAAVFLPTGVEVITVYKDEKLISGLVLHVPTKTITVKLCILTW